MTVLTFTVGADRAEHLVRVVLEGDAERRDYTLTLPEAQRFRKELEAGQYVETFGDGAADLAVLLERAVNDAL